MLFMVKTSVFLVERWHDTLRTGTWSTGQKDPDPEWFCLHRVTDTQTRNPI